MDRSYDHWILLPAVSLLSDNTVHLKVYCHRYRTIAIVATVDNLGTQRYLASKPRQDNDSRD